MKKVRDVLSRLRRRLFDPYVRKSYAQCGEDLIVRHVLLDVLGRNQISYLDIGAHDPWFLSNTALFYRLGFSGVCVEPDIALHRNLRRHRTRDICVNAGVAGAEGEADFYIMSARTLNTFSKEEAQRYETEGHRIEQVVRLPLLSPTAILERYCTRCPEFISIDVEGLDLAIVKAFDFQAYRPDVLCVETTSHAQERSGWKKNHELLELMESVNYFAYADTFINTVFVNRAIW